MRGDYLNCQQISHGSILLRLQLRMDPDQHRRTENAKDNTMFTYDLGSLGDC